MITQGRHTYLGNFEERFDPVVEIGNFSSVGSGAHFYGTAQHPMTVSTFPFTDKHWCDESVYPKSYSRGKIVIGNDVWIGEDVKILDGVTIHDGAVIGAGSVVSKDIPAYAIAVGNPIEVKKYRFTPKIRRKLREMKWWDRTDDEIKELLPYMSDVDVFFEVVL